MTGTFNGRPINAMSGTYESWLAKVDGFVSELAAGLSIDDLEDCNLADWWEAGVSPRSAAKKAIRNSGGTYL